MASGKHSRNMPFPILAHPWQWASFYLQCVRILEAKSMLPYHQRWHNTRGKDRFGLVHWHCPTTLCQARPKIAGAADQVLPLRTKLLNQSSLTDAEVLQQPCSPKPCGTKQSRQAAWSSCIHSKHIPRCVLKTKGPSEKL